MNKDIILSIAGVIEEVIYRQYIEHLDQETKDRAFNFLVAKVKEAMALQCDLLRKESEESLDNSPHTEFDLYEKGYKDCENDMIENLIKKSNELRNELKACK